MLELIHTVLRLFIFVIFIDVVLSYLPDMKRQKWAQVLHKIADAPQKPIREALPQDLPLDPSPMIVIIVINMLMYLL
ncbi:MAG TPA: YggT family protein [Bacteriovoracaceae bacterium]|nr:YggT family protein [Bacteriovoracaceae bacterium]